MKKSAWLNSLLAANERWLMRRILHYASVHDYTRYTSTLEEAWRQSIHGLSTAMSRLLENDECPSPWGVEESLDSDPVSAFGVLEAKKHRERGVRFEMFLGLMKYYRESYLDLIAEQELAEDDLEWGRRFILGFFDRMELAFASEWVNVETDQNTDGLQTANRHLANEKNLYLTIFESILTPVLLFDQEHQLINFNHSAATLFIEQASPGSHYYGHKELGLEWLPAEVRYFIEAGRSNRRFEFVLPTAEGEKPFDLRVQRMLDLSGKFHGSLLVLEDLSKSKRVEADLRYAKDLAEAANVAKSQFLANMSHEIRTPLNGIVGMTGLLMDSGLEGEKKDFAEIVRTSADSLLGVINDILDFSKIEAGRLDLEEIEFDLRAEVESAVDLVGLRAHQKDLELVCLISEDVSSMVVGDPGRLRQVLLNLLGNAVKFTERGEVFLQVTLEFETSDIARLRFEVRDTGIGVQPEHRNKLFEKFSQVDASTTRRFGGTGLGLAISRELVEMMGGRIGYREAEGGGACFWFTLELKKSNLDVLPPSPSASLHGARVLVVDDNATNRRLLHELLTRWGCVCVECASGAQALGLIKSAAAENRSFSIALLDWQMPEMDGLELGRRIRAEEAGRDIALVALSSLVRRGDGPAFTQAGFSAFLTKPIKRSDLYLCLLEVQGETVHSARKTLVTSHTLMERRNRRVRILVVEDNTVNQKVAVRLLEKLGFSADIAANGEEAVTACAMIPYDLVFMDIQMPVMDGLEATRLIRKKQKNVASVIIAMTAHAFGEDRQRCLDAGMDDFISKPVSIEAIRTLLRKWQVGDNKEAGLQNSEHSVTD